MSAKTPITDRVVEENLHEASVNEVAELRQLARALEGYASRMAEADTLDSSIFAAADFKAWKREQLGK